MCAVPRLLKHLMSQKVPRPAIQALRSMLCVLLYVPLQVFTYVLEPLFSNGTSGTGPHLHQEQQAQQVSVAAAEEPRSRGLLVAEPGKLTGWELRLITEYCEQVRSRE